MTVEGSLPKEQVQATVKQHHLPIQYCSRWEGALDARRSGTLTMAFTIGPDGSVLETLVKSNTLGNPRVTECVDGQITQMTLPPPNGGGIVSVTCSFTFSAAP